MPVRTVHPPERVRRIRAGPAGSRSLVVQSGWAPQYDAENFDRLVELKTTYDRTNLFNNAQSIPPHSS